eukprot:379746-Amorphochlora_amoeboformis.AAC.3
MCSYRRIRGAGCQGGVPGHLVGLRRVDERRGEDWKEAWRAACIGHGIARIDWRIITTDSSVTHINHPVNFFVLGKVSLQKPISNAYKLEKKFEPYPRRSRSVARAPASP